MKKIFLFIVTAVFALTLTACGKKGEITLRYAAWNLGVEGSSNAERLMIQKFMDLNPTIKIEVVERPKVENTTGDGEVDQEWNEFLDAHAANKKLPDVFMIDSTETVVNSRWAYNLAEIASKDPEFLNIKEAFRDAGSYDGKLIALPSQVHYYGYFVNKKIYDDGNKDVPTFGIEFEDLMSRTKAVAKHQSGGNGIVGIEGINRLLEWYPAQLKEEYGWFTYDEANKKLHLDSTEFGMAVDKYYALRADNTFVLDACTPEQRTDYFGAEWPWGAGRHALKWDSSASIGWMNKAIKTGEYGFEIDFIGTPKVGNINKIPVIVDQMSIASTTKYPQEAYDFAKWMSFGKAGYSNRLTMSEEMTDISTVNFAPLQNDQEMTNRFFTIYSTFTSLKTIIEEHDSFIIEPNKYIPGYNQARFHGTYDATLTLGNVFHEVLEKTLVYADIRTEWNKQANKALADANNTFYENIAKLK